MLILAMQAVMIGLMQDAPPATRPAGGDGLLSGPAVVETQMRPTMVHRAFDGTLEEVDPEPDVTAVGLVELTETQRDRYNAILSERMTAFDDLVRAHYGLILELASLQGQDNPQRALEVAGKLRGAFESYLKRGSFLTEMRPHLAASQLEQIHTILDEYRDAKADDLRKSMGKDATPQQLVVRGRLESFGKMIRASIERQVGMAREEFEHLATELNLTEEQKSKAQAIFQPLAVKRFQKLDTPADRADAFRQFNKILTGQQRAKVFSILVKQWQDERTADVAKPGSDDARTPATAPSN